MADKNTGWSCVHGVSIVSENELSVTLRVWSCWQNNGWTYNISNVTSYVNCNGIAVQVMANGNVNASSSGTQQVLLGSHDFVITKTTSVQNIKCDASIIVNSSYLSGTKLSSASTHAIAAIPSHTVSYNANGGPWAPGSQTKWYGTVLTLDSTKPTRTGYTFQGWSTANDSTVEYAAGAQYGADEDVTLYAVWKANTYIVSYNANGGTGAPGNQTKTYGQNLTLSSTIPTRTNYNFKGWSTSAGGSVIYAAGATYTNNSAVTLYAVWELAYIRPRITNFSAQRCTSDGTTSESGTYIKASFNWATDKTVSSIKINYKIQNGSSWTEVSVTASGTSGSVTQVIGEGTISTETSYQCNVSVSDSGGSSSSGIISIGTIKYPIDIRKGGKGVTIGGVAENDGFRSKMSTYFEKDTHVTGTFGVYSGAVADFNNMLTEGEYIVGRSGLNNHPYGNNITAYGKLIVKVSNGETHNNSSNWIWQYFMDTSGRFFYRYKVNNGAWKSWRNLSLNGYVYSSLSLYSNDSGSNGTITLSSSAANFSYLEIYYFRNGSNIHECVKVRAPNGKNVTLDIPYSDPSSSLIQITSKIYSISGTSITVNKAENYVNLQPSGIYHSTSSNIRITEVIGYSTQ